MFIVVVETGEKKAKKTSSFFYYIVENISLKFPLENCCYLFVIEARLKVEGRIKVISKYPWKVVFNLWKISINNKF